MKKGKKVFHPLKGKELEELFEAKISLCGYSRSLQINLPQTIVMSYCALIKQPCNYRLPQSTSDCKHYKRLMRENREVNFQDTLEGLAQYFHTGLHFVHSKERIFNR